MLYIHKQKTDFLILRDALNPESEMDSRFISTFDWRKNCNYQRSTIL